jgi:hypothetical protein
MADLEPANPSFELDRYTVWPGTAGGNGRAIAGWSYTGNAGVNPVWKDPQARKGPESPFHDNGAVPEGRQLAFIQGPGKLSQMIGGFRQGAGYVIGYRENARIQRQGDQWPRVRVTLGGQVIVSEHEVTPIAKRDDFEAPFYRVESAVFTAPADGPFELTIETVQESRTTTVLLDAVIIREVGERDEP